MAITVNWNTKVISVPQADLTFITGTLYEMDTDSFRLQLKVIEASEEGMPFEDTHIHNTQVTVAGTTFFRTIEIINGYSVQFTPNTQWSVRLAGSNNNIFDVENSILVQNQVQVIAQNSAGGQIVETGTSGLTASESLQFNEMHGQVRRSVYINTEAVAAGNGYQQTPFNTFTSAVDFAETNGLTKLILLADAVVDRQLKNFIFEGIGDPVLDINSQIIDKSEFNDLSLDGIIGTGSTIHAHDCTLRNNISGLQGTFIECRLGGNLTLATGSQTVMNDCYSVIGGLSKPFININGGTANVSIRNYTGGLIIGGVNDSGDQVTVSMNMGKLTLDNTNTLGVISVRGLSQFTDNSAGSVIDTEGLLDTFQQGLLVKLMKNRLETDPATGILTIYDDDGVTVLLSGNIYEDVLAAQAYRGRGLERRDKLA